MRIVCGACASVLFVAGCASSGELPACGPGSEDACAIALGDALPIALAESTDGRASDHGSPGCVDASDAPDVAFRWTAPYAGRFDVSTVGSSFDTVLSIRRGGCDGEEIACVDDVGTVRQASATVELAACETIVIVVDGFSPGEHGAVQLSIATRETACDDGLDDDGDGLVDCDDVDDCRTRACIDDGSWPEGWSDFEWGVLDATNRNRAAGASCGGEAFGPAPPLEMDETIRVAARLHSQDMASQDYFEHDSLDGRSYTTRMTDAGFTGAAPWGENIAAGSQDPESVVQGWMESPGHCANIMSPRYRVIGIGYAYEAASTFGHYWTQDFAGGH